MNGHGYPGDDASPDIDLSVFDDDFNEAPIEEREFDEVPDGKFQVQVDKVELTTAKSSGNAMLKWTLRILGPKYAGRLLWRNNVIATRENVRWLKNDLHTCGLDLVRLSDLRDHLPQLLDVQLEVTKRTKGDSVNIYFNRRLVLDEQGTGGAYGRAMPDDIPFWNRTVIIVDTREQEPYVFDPERVTIVRRALPAGDYSLDGHETAIAAERKSLDDYVTSVVAKRDRFARELRILSGYDVACVVVEATLEDVLAHRYRSGAHPSAVLGATLSIIIDKNVPVFFCGDRQIARRFVEGLLCRYHQKVAGA